MVIYSYDANGILLRAIKNRTGDELSTTLESAFDYLTERGFKPKFHIMDNEAAIKTINMIKRQKINLQLAPPDLHRRSPAERAIRTAKNHILSGLASTHDKFPTHLWCRLIQQAEMTLNMLRPCRTNPKLSAYTALEGEFNFERTPLAPPDTGGTITAETFSCTQDNKFRIPEVTPEEELWTAAKNLTKAITKNSGPKSFIGDKIDELKKLNKIFVQRIQQCTKNPPLEQNNEPYQQPRVEPQQKEIETEDPEPRVVEPTMTNNDEPPELVDEDETPSYEEWQRHINQTTDELKTPKRLISRSPIKYNR